MAALLGTLAIAVYVGLRLSASAAQPVLLVLEDLHAAHDDSLALVR